MIDIRHDCYYCVELDRIDRDWFCFPPVGNGELSAECDPTMVCQEDGEEDVGRVELCALVLLLHSVCIILQLRQDLALALRQGQGHPSIIPGVLQDPDSNLLGPPGLSPYFPTLSSESSP